LTPFNERFCNASIANGLFEFSFVVPRDIRIPLADGRISFYAKKDQTLENETGFDTSNNVKKCREDNIPQRSYI
jgi:hypothetical protein